MGYEMAGLLGLGAAGDIFHAISSYEQARRQRQLYNKANDQYNYQKQFQNPQWVAQQSQPYINQLNATLAEQTPYLMRTQVNPLIGSRGIDPTSGAGQSIYANALAPYIQQNTQQGVQNFLSASGQGTQGVGQGLQYGGQNVGQTYGTGNNLQQMLMQYYGRGGAAVPNTMSTGSKLRSDGLEGLSQYAVNPSGTTSAQPWEKQFLTTTGAPGWS